MEAAHKASLAKGEVGIREHKALPTLSEFADQRLLPFVEALFADNPKTLEYDKTGIKRIRDFPDLADSRLDAVSQSMITVFTQSLRADGLQVTSLNRVLEVLRRMLRLASEWGELAKAPPKGRCFSVRMRGTGSSRARRRTGIWPRQHE